MEKKPLNFSTFKPRKSPFDEPKEEKKPVLEQPEEEKKPDLPPEPPVEQPKPTPAPQPRPIRTRQRQPLVRQVVDTPGRVKYTATMDVDLRRRLKIAAAQYDLQLSAFIEEACREKLEREGL